MDTCKYSCESCNFKTNAKLSFQSHLLSEKHKRNGQNRKCEYCYYESTSPWNLKIHIILKHLSIDEKRKQKYYCDICDNMFLCSLYYEKHIDGKKHKNNVKLAKEKAEKKELECKNLDIKSKINIINKQLRANYIDLYNIININHQFNVDIEE